MTKIWDEVYSYCLEAQKLKEVPVAAALVKDGSIISIEHNQVESRCDPTNHAEVLALKEAFKKYGKNLSGFNLYVSLEPCPMCAEAIRISQISNLYFGAYDPKNGGVEHGPKLLDRSPHPNVYGGFHEELFSKILRDFFQKLR